MGVNATPNDRAKLRELLADKISNVQEVKAYADEQSLDFTPSAQAEIRRLKAQANGFPDESDEQREALAWVLAYEFVLEDSAS